MQSEVDWQQRVDLGQVSTKGVVYCDGSAIWEQVQVEEDASSLQPTWVQSQLPDDGHPDSAPQMYAMPVSGAGGQL